MPCNCGKNKRRSEPTRNNSTPAAPRGMSEPTPAAAPVTPILGATIEGVDTNG